MPKKYENINKLIDKKKFYSLEEAIDIFKESKYNFDRSINFCFRASFKKKNNQLSGSSGFINLPYGNGKQKKILLITGYSDLINHAKELGVDIVGGKEIIDKIIAEKKVPECDVILATSDMMPNIMEIAKILGPKGLMPNTKNGTVVVDDDKEKLKEKLDKIVEEIKLGKKVEYRLNKDGCIMLSFAKMSFDIKKIKENFEYVVKAISNKYNFDFSKSKVSVNATMSPSVKINISNNNMDK